MSTLRLTTLSNQGGTASVPSDTVINGTAKAWVNFNGTGTVAIRAAFNVSSITDNGTGDYTVNMTSAISDGNYGVSVTSQAPIDNISSECIMYNQTPSAGSFRMRTGVVGSAYYDCSFVYATVFR